MKNLTNISKTLAMVLLVATVFTACQKEEVIDLDQAKFSTFTGVGTDTGGGTPVGGDLGDLDADLGIVTLDPNDGINGDVGVHCNCYPIQTNGDINGDGDVNGHDFVALGNEANEVDLNNDGTLSDSELEAYAQNGGNPYLFYFLMHTTTSGNTGVFNQADTDCFYLYVQGLLDCD